LGNLYLDDELTEFLLYKSVFKLTLALVALAVLVRLGLFYVNDINRNKIISSISIILLLFLSINYVTNNIAIPLLSNSHTLFLLSTITTGLFEEIFNRLLVFGMIYCYLDQLKTNSLYFKAVLLSSIVFGILHLSNLLDSDYDKLSVINQAILATGVGFLLQVLLVRIKNLIFIIFLHSTMNYLGSYRIIQEFNYENQSKFLEMSSFEIAFNLAMFAIISCVLILIGYVILNSTRNRLNIRCRNNMA
jgi:membrane protease YdiL (CAAX protease family)